MLSSVELNRPQIIFLRVVAVFYFIGAMLHLADFFDLRLHFSEMDVIWKMWIVYLLVLDTVTAIGLWKNKFWGIAAFFVVSISQLVAYLTFRDFFGSQWPLIVFHLIALGTFFYLGGLRRLYSRA